MTVSSYFRPTSVPEAIGLLEAYGSDLLVIAGGTVAMPLVNEGVARPRVVMGLRRAVLAAIEETAAGLRIGATTTLTALAEQQSLPMLATAARCSASWSVRNMATAGGNLFSPPRGGDLATALLALDASVEATGPRGTRSVPLAAFFTGLMTTALAPGELVTAIDVPRPTGIGGFLKLGRRPANTPAVVSVAVSIVVDGPSVTEARVALGGAGPHPVRVPDAEAALVGETLGARSIRAAADAATRASEPLTDAVASDWYRRRMVGVVVGRALEELRQGVPGVVA